MAKFGPKDMTVHIEDAPGGASQELTNFVIEGFDVSIESLLEETTALGDEWEEHTPVGMKRVPPFSLTCLMDDTATTGTQAIFANVDDGPGDAPREMIVVWGGATYTFGVRLGKVAYSTAKARLQRIVSEVQPTGSLVQS